MRRDPTELGLLLALPILIALAFVLPKWIVNYVQVSLGTGLVALGVMLQMRAGLVSFGQGLYFCVGGFLRPTSGQILFDGTEITGMSSRKITRMGLCRSFQIPQLFPELTVIENVQIALTIAGSDRPALLRPAVSPALEEAAHDLLTRFGIDAYASQEIIVLPQGVRKLVDIAMATVSNPKLLFLDEPTSGVSNEEKVAFMDRLIKALTSAKTAVLFIEHDMEIVEAFSPRCVAFYEGTILSDGPTGEVLQNSDVREYVIGTELHREEQESAPC